MVNQAEADRDIPKLLAVPARVRFLSIEPMLGPIDIGRWITRHAVNEHGDCARWCNACSIRKDANLDWVICGGESGPKARPMHPDWARSLRDQCAPAGVPFLFKQHGEWAPGSGDFGAGAFQTAAIERTGQIVVPGGLTVAAYPKGAESRDGWAMVHRPGKKAAGRLLDGRAHDGFPEITR